MKDIKNVNSILEISKRTIGKMLERANKGCVICQWNIARCDVHHIIERREGGSDELDNLIVICPNCHRSVHVLGDKYISKEEMVKKSIAHTFIDWKDYYNLFPEYIKRKDEKCFNLNCNIIVPKNKKRKHCSQECMRVSKVKFDWNAIDLKALLLEYNYNLYKIGKIIGVSDNAIRKFCKKNFIEIEKIKFKTKRHVLF